MKEIFTLTNEKRTKKQYGFLRNFDDREVSHFHNIDEPITFEIECLFKNLNDQDPSCVLQDPEEDHDYFSNFKLCSLFLKDHHLQHVLLCPSSVMTFRTMLVKKAGIKAFPFCQIRRYK